MESGCLAPETLNDGEINQILDFLFIEFNEGLSMDLLLSF